MLHLPNEIWLQIASYCDPRDLWLSLRPTNRQLLECAEQYIKQEVLPKTTLFLQVVIPTYDMRIPIRGQVIFKPISHELTSTEEPDSDAIVYCLGDTDSDYYLPHFLTRWSTMQSRETGHLDARRLQWQFELNGKRDSVKLYQSRAIRHGCQSGEARVSFDWRYTLTSYFRA